MDSPQHPSLSPGTVIAYAGIVPERWRNGGGVTRQIAAGTLGAAGIPESVPGDAWDWRLSIADVESEGPFSVFAGMTRVLTVIEGQGLAITMDGVDMQLDRYAPLRFDGGAATSARLPGGPIRDFNLIARTGTVDGRVDLAELVPGRPLALAAGRLGVLLRGRACLSPGHSGERPLERYDTVVGGGDPVAAVEGDGLLAVVALAPVGH